MMISLAMTIANTVKNTTVSQTGNLVKSLRKSVVVENGKSHDHGIERNVSGRIRKEDKIAVTAVNNRVEVLILTVLDNVSKPRTEMAVRSLGHQGDKTAWLKIMIEGISQGTRKKFRFSWRLAE